MPEFNAHFSGAAATRRKKTNSNSTASSSGAPLHIDIDAPPKAWKFAPFLSLAFILIFFSLQLLLPATHYRHPFDPHRQWKPYASNFETANEISTNVSMHTGVLQIVNIFSWIDDLDIRPLAVIVNSTIFNSRYPGHIHFHFFLPDDLDEEHSHYKLKVFFPKSNIVVQRHTVIREKVKRITADDEYGTSNFAHVLAFYIPKIYQNIGRFIYLAPDVVVKDKIEDLFQVDLQSFALAAVEDCSQNFGAYRNFEVINAIQRSGAKPWVAQVPYENTTCILDLSVLLVDAGKLAKENITETMKWWRKVLPAEGERESQSDQSVLLALYGKYMRIDGTWNIRGSKFSGMASDIKILHFDGEKPWLKQAADGVYTDFVDATALVNMYAKCGSIEKTRELFDKMPQRTVVSWIAMAARYAQNGFVEKALETFQQMKLASVKPNSTTSTSELTSQPAPIWELRIRANVTADHRIIYGADLVGFLQTIAKVVEHPEARTL